MDDLPELTPEQEAETAGFRAALQNRLIERYAGRVLTADLIEEIKAQCMTFSLIFPQMLEHEEE